LCSSIDTKKVAEWRYESAPENRSGLEGIHALSTGITKASASESGLVAATVPRKLFTVHRQLILKTKGLIKALNKCKSKENFDHESRKFKLLKSEYLKFRNSLCELNDYYVLNQLSADIVDKLNTCQELHEALKEKFCDKDQTNTSNKSGESDYDDIEPTDSISLMTTSCVSVSSSKSSEVRRIELERKLSELQVLEELAKSRRLRANAEAKAKAEAE